MSGRKAIIKSMIVVLCFGIFFLVIGSALYTSLTAEDTASSLSEGFIIVEAQVEDVTEYKNTGVRKGRRFTSINYIADVSFEYGGKSYNCSISGMPMVSAGDITDIYFNPSTGEVRGKYNELEFFFGMLAYTPAYAFMAIGGIIILCAVVSAIRKLSVFNEKNRVYGEIVEVEENFNVVIGHKHPKIAICTFDEPGTGKRLRVRSANSLLDLFSMVGMNVPIYYNRHNPVKSFVDLENAYGGTLSEESRPAVHDFRNL